MSSISVRQIADRINVSAQTLDRIKTSFLQASAGRFFKIRTKQAREKYWFLWRWVGIYLATEDWKAVVTAAARFDLVGQCIGM
ncbi:MAG: hypothetical protein ACUVRS_08920 [Armatimonadota bacterium]